MTENFCPVGRTTVTSAERGQKAVSWQGVQPGSGTDPKQLEHVTFQDGWGCPPHSLPHQAVRQRELEGYLSQLLNYAYA